MSKRSGIRHSSQLKQSAATGLDRVVAALVDTAALAGDTQGEGRRPSLVAVAAERTICRHTTGHT